MGKEICLWRERDGERDENRDQKKLKEREDSACLDRYSVWYKLANKASSRLHDNNYVLHNVQKSDTIYTTTSCIVFPFADHLQVP